MLNATDLKELRSTQQSLMSQTYESFRPTLSNDSFGSSQFTYPLTPTSSGICRIMRFPRKSFGIVSEISEKLDIQDIRVLIVKHTDDLVEGDKIVSNSKTYEIVNNLIVDTPFMHCKRFLVRIV